MSLEVTKQELLKQAIYLNKLYATTRNQEYKAQETRIRRIVVELDALIVGTSTVANLDDLLDVVISAPANAQVLVYNSTTSQWENQTPAAGGGGGDMSKSTYDVDNDGVVDSAERTEIIVRNSTGTTLTKGTIVYLSGATGNRPNAVRSQADTEATSSKTIGMVVANISNNSDGYVATNGTLHDLDTSAFAAGNALWLSATVAGGMTSTIPVEPNHTVFIGYVARSHPTQGRLVILIQNGYELNELHGVLISSEANNDLLVYETSTTLWKNKTFSAIFGGTPLISVPTLAQVTTAGNISTDDISVGRLTVNTSSLIVFPTTFNIGINTATDSGQKLQVLGNTFIKGTDSLLSTKVFEIQNGAGASIMDFRNATYAFFGCGQGGGSNSGFIFNYSNTSYTQFSGYNYGAGSGAYKPILMDTDIAGRGQGIFVNFGTVTLLPPNSDTEFAVRGRTADATSFISRFRESGNTDRFAIRADGALFTNTLQGYSGSVAVTTPTGTKTFTITNGLITNVV